MSTDEEFLELIRADLDNPAPRLVYADWLDELGDPQGEFIRVQCELECDGLSALKQRQLRERERELLDEHQADWLEPVASMKLKTAEWKFRRGFVEEVTIESREFMERGDFFHHAFPFLNLLTLRGIVYAPEGLASSSALERLTGLRLTGNLVREANEGWPYLGENWGIRMIPRSLRRILSSEHWGNLRRLDLGGLSLDEPSLIAALACSNLRLENLDLSHNRFEMDAIQSLASASCVTNLQTLSLRSVGLKIEHLLVLTYSQHLKSLKALDLSGNIFASSPQLLALVRLEHFDQLKDLELRACRLVNAGVMTIARSTLWHQLERLILWNNEITDRGLIAIAEGEPPAKLRSLELQRNEIGDAGLSALAGSPVLEAFLEIHLEHNHIEEGGTLALARSGHAGRMRELHLRGNASLGDKGGIALASAGFPSLEVLDLAGTEVGDSTARTIAATPASASLRILDLGRTRITEAGALALAESQFLGSLEFLDLRMNRLSGNCVTALKERFGYRALM